MAEMMHESHTLQVLDYAVAALAIPGQVESGDLHIVRDLPNKIVIGVVDGLGHGAEAAAAAKLAISTIEAATTESIIGISNLCHKQLRNTRGVVTALLSINVIDETMTWFSIGNIEGILVRADQNAVPQYENIIMRPGVVGYKLPPISASVTSLFKGDIIILSTDGVRSDFAPRIVMDLKANSLAHPPIPHDDPGEGHDQASPKKRSVSPPPGVLTSLSIAVGSTVSPQDLADYICSRFSKGSDDALVLAARYLGKI